MHARDAAGRRVSLLNEEPVAHSTYSTRPSLVAYNSSFSSVYSGSSIWSSDDSRARRSASVTSSISNPSTPDMACADSYEPHIAEPISPTTPMMDYDKSAYYSTSGKADLAMYHEYSDERPAKARKMSHDDDDASTRSTSRSTSDKSSSGKRYPCRFKASHGCDKTFTTSGHASRHSKIHTAEKAVNCSFPGCQKKFTRADNMKQHLETHYKERSRSSSKSTSKTTPPGLKRASTSSSSKSSHTEPAAYPQEAYANRAIYETMDMAEFRTALLSRPVAGRTDSSGLDALASLASACQAQC